MQNSTKGQSSMSGYKLIVAIDLTIPRNFPPSIDPDPPTQYVAIIKMNVPVFICSLALWETISTATSASMREANLKLLRLKRIADGFSSTT